MKAFVNFVILFIQIFAELLSWSLFIYVLLSWFSQGRTQFGVWLDSIVRPMLRPFRWARIGVFDLSIIVVFLLLQYGARFLIQALFQFSETL